MPNKDNVISPFTIIGNGRSGTSLVSTVLRAHSQCSFAGETVNLIHSVWKSLESSLGQKQQEKIPEVIRQQFMMLFPNQSKHWMHKPIGIPIIWNLFPCEEDFYVWFWDVLEAVFPNAKYFTVLRHPLDVVTSSSKWWGYPHRTVIESNRKVANLITHPRSKVEYAVNYHLMVEDPENEVRKLFDYLGLEVEPKCLEQFDVGHVMNSQEATKQPSLETRKQSGFSHRDAWKQIDPSCIGDSYRNAVDACWSKFGHDFGGWPNL